MLLLILAIAYIVIMFVIDAIREFNARRYYEALLQINTAQGLPPGGLSQKMITKYIDPDTGEWDGQTYAYFYNGRFFYPQIPPKDQYGNPNISFMHYQNHKKLPAKFTSY